MSIVFHPEISDYYKDMLELADAHRAKTLVDPTKKAQGMRKACVRKRHGKTEIRCVNYAVTEQKKDILRRTDMPLDTITTTNPYRFKIDTKEFDPNERVKKSRDETLPEHVRNEYSEPFDFNDIRKIFNAFATKYNFDMPMFSLRKANRPLKDIRHFDLALIPQIMGCTMHDWTSSGGCTYCYVDANSNTPTTPNWGIWLGVENMLQTVKELREDPSIRGGLELHRIRVSGGCPTTALDFVRELAETIETEGIEELYVQFDTNLSTAKFIKGMVKEKKYDKDILSSLGGLGVCSYVAFKGTTRENIIHNTQADVSVEDQLEALGMLVDNDIQVLPCIYNPDYKTFPDFIDKLNENFDNASKLLRVEAIKWDYEPTKARIKCIADAIHVPVEYLFSAYKTEESLNYQKCEEFMLHYIGNKYGLPYKQFDRTQYAIVRNDDLPSSSVRRRPPGFQSLE